MMLRSRLLMLLLGLALVAFGLSACGGSDNSASSQAAPAPVQSPQTIVLSSGSLPVLGESGGFLLCSVAEAQRAAQKFQLTQIKQLDYQHSCQLLLVGASEPSSGYQMSLDDLEAQGQVLNAVVTVTAPKGTTAAVISRPYLLLAVDKAQLGDAQSFKVVINSKTAK